MPHPDHHSGTPTTCSCSGAVQLLTPPARSSAALPLRAQPSARECVSEVYVFTASSIHECAERGPGGAAARGVAGRSRGACPIHAPAGRERGEKGEKRRAGTHVLGQDTTGAGRHTTIRRVLPESCTGPARVLHDCRSGPARVLPESCSGPARVPHPGSAFGRHGAIWRTRAPRERVEDLTAGLGHGLRESVTTSPAVKVRRAWRMDFRTRPYEKYRRRLPFMRRCSIFKI